jgi:hypothetical protein
MPIFATGNWLTGLVFYFEFDKRQFFTYPTRLERNPIKTTVEHFKFGLAHAAVPQK